MNPVETTVIIRHGNNDDNDDNSNNNFQALTANSVVKVSVMWHPVIGF